ncbi:MAG: 4Fe-4S ferredoxin [Thermodesulfovibrio sp.]|nr:4Fe-4S ferredoxin [Thermodesulfovibrio sp.]
MALRNIIEIDEAKCDGCGNCVTDCAEAALQIVNGKAKLIKEIYCDGLGACLGACPTGALKVVQRESAPFDEKATEKHMEEVKKMKETPCGCPGTKTVDFSGQSSMQAAGHGAAETTPELTNWPIQLKLMATTAPYLNNADLLLAADCTAFSTVNFHGRFIKGKKVIIGCPKLDDAQFYLEKLTEIFRTNEIKSLSVVRMEVPCCGGLSFIAKKAIEASGKAIPYSEVIIGIKGETKSEGMTPLIPKLQSVG